MASIIRGMTHRRTVAFTLIGALILAGCQVDTRPVDVAQFSTNRSPVKDSAPHDGKFVLYRDDVVNITQPIVTTAHLQKDEMVGFEIDEHQVPFAVAGSKRIQLEAGRYRWEMTADTGQVDWEKTNAVVLQVVVITAAVGATVILSIVLAKHA